MIARTLGQPRTTSPLVNQMVQPQQPTAYPSGPLVNLMAGGQQQYPSGPAVNPTIPMPTSTGTVGTQTQMPTYQPMQTSGTSPLVQQMMGSQTPQTGAT